MRKMKKIASIVLTISLLCSMFGNVVYATNSVSTIQTKVNTIVDAIAYFGYAVAVAMFLFVGIKYTMAPANEKADVRLWSINYLIGAFLIFCASGVTTIFAEIALGDNKSQTAESMATTIVESML